MEHMNNSEFDAMAHKLIAQFPDYATVDVALYDDRGVPVRSLAVVRGGQETYRIKVVVGKE